MRPNGSRERTVVGAFFWPAGRARIAWMLGMSGGRIKRIWARAKLRGDLPKIARPAKGVKL